MSLETKLIVEIDGSQHYTEEGIDKDKKRDQYFKSERFTVLRFNNIEVLENIDGVLETIWQVLPHNKQDK